MKDYYSLNAKLINGCLSTSPEDKPSFDEILKIISGKDEEIAQFWKTPNFYIILMRLL